MTTFRTLLAALLLAGLLPGFQAPPPQDEYKTKLATLSKSTAAKHYAIADYLAGAQMFLWAREQLYKTIEFDPDHEGARKRLGYKKGDDGWESDPAAKQEFGNKKKGEDAERVRKQYIDRLDSAGRDLSRLWGDLALFCKKNSMAAESASAFMKALEYDPANATARKELGYEKDAKGVWMSRAERDLRKEMKDGIGRAPGGEAATRDSLVEKAAGVKTKKRESDHFICEAPHLSEASMTSILQRAEHTYAMFHKMFNQTDLFKGVKLTLLVLKDRAQHDRYVDNAYKGDPAKMQLLHECRCTGGFPYMEIYQETASDDLLFDWTIHMVTQVLMETWCGGAFCWVLEGMALHFCRLMTETSLVHCVDLAGTSPRNKGKNYSNPADWPVICRVWVRENKDPDMTAIMKRTNFGEFDGADAVKSWSMVDYLLAQHRDKFIEFLVALRELSDPKENKVVDGGVVETALKKVWGWTINDLDYRWKQYVKVAY